jgi:hypothetical protein
MNASPAEKPLTPRLAVPPLPKGEGEKSKSQPSPRGEGARRRKAGEGSLSTPLDFDGALLLSGSTLDSLGNLRHSPKDDKNAHIGAYENMETSYHFSYCNNVTDTLNLTFYFKFNCIQV